MEAQPDQAKLIIGASEVDADLYYATRFLAPDALVYLEAGGRKLLMASDLELDRARSQAHVDEVLAMSSYQDRARKRGVAGPNQLHALVELLRERAIRDIDVPRTFPIEAADFLRERDYKVSWHQGAYFPQREHKTREEIDEIRKVQRHTEANPRGGTDGRHHVTYLCQCSLLRGKPGLD